MKDISKFGNVVGTPSGVGRNLDVPGSSQDVIFADAIIANEPTSILEEAGIVTVRKVPADVDEIAFPIIRNTQFTWYDMDGRTGSNSLGSDLSASALGAVEYRKVRPTTKTANIFMPDEVSLVNKTNFDLYARIGAMEAKRKKEADTIGSLVLETGLGNIYAAGGFTSSGSVSSGSTLDPLDLVKSKTVLMTGSNINPPDFVLMHPEQYEQVNTHADFAPGATTNGAMLRKARFNEDGDVVRFDGMDIFVTELVPSAGSTTITADVTNNLYTVKGHPVIVGARGKAVCRGEHMGIRVSTEDSRRRHGQWKIFDVSYGVDKLVTEAIVLIRAAD